MKKDRSGPPEKPAAELRPHPKKKAPAFLTVAEVAKELRIHVATVYRQIEIGNIRAVRIGRSVRVHASELARLVASALPPSEVEGGGPQ